MKSTFLFIFSLFIFLHSYSQAPSSAGKQAGALKDSLLHELSVAKLDTNKVNVLNSLSFLLKDVNPDEGIRYGKDAVTLSQHLHSSTHKAKALNSLGHNYRIKNDYAAALECFEEAMSIEKSNNNKAGIANNYNNFGLIYNSLSQYSKAIDYYLEAVRVYEEMGDRASAGKISTNIGLCYGNVGDHDKALEYYSKSLPLAKERKDNNGVVAILINSGNAHKSKGDYEKALQYFHEAADLNKSVGNKNWEQANLISTGDVYFRTKKYQEAIWHFEQALQIAESLGLPMKISMAKDRIASAYIEGMRTNSLPNDMCCEIAREKIEKYLGEAAEIATSKNNIHGLAAIYNSYSVFKETIGDYKEAFEKYKEFIKLKDSVISEDKRKEITQKTMQYEFSKKEDSMRFTQQLIEAQLKQQTLLAQQHQQDLLLKQRELGLAQTEKELHLLQESKMQVELKAEQSRSRENEKQLIIASQMGDLQKVKLSLARVKLQRQRILFYAGAGLFILLVIFLVSYFNNRRKLHVERLRNKISRDLHDEVGSALSSVSLMNEMALRGNDGGKMRSNISESLLRAQNAMSEIVWMLNSRNDSLDNLVLRIGEVAREMLELKGISYQLQVTGDVSKAKISMEKRREIFLVLKECLNNILKYADCSEVVITLHASNRMMHLSVSDNGRGFDPAIVNSGNGLHNMKGRATIMKGIVNVDTAPGMGTRVELAVPLA